MDVAEAVVNEWKYGFCKSNPFKTAEACCKEASLTATSSPSSPRDECEAFHLWSTGWWTSFAIYMAFALVFGIIAGAVTLTTKRCLPSCAPGKGDRIPSETLTSPAQSPTGKSMYMAAGSGIPEIKTHLSGFMIPHLLDLRVLLVKAIGSTFAVVCDISFAGSIPFNHVQGFLLQQHALMLSCRQLA